MAEVAGHAQVAKSRENHQILLQILAACQVAVKRIPDVLSSPEQAKRVLREICILRRLTHPFIIELKNAFVQPSATGELTLYDEILQEVHRLAWVCIIDTANELLAVQGQAD